MFCSKCGKEINDDAAFCSSCGNSVNVNVSVPSSVSVQAASVSRMPMEEKEKKIWAVATFIIYSIMLIAASIIMISTEITCLNIFVGGDYEEELEYLWEEASFLFYIIAIVIFLLFIIQSVQFYLLPWMKRNFSEHSSKQFFSNFSDAAIDVIGSIIIASMLSEELDISFPSGVVIVGIVFAAMKLIVGIAYRAAANAEVKADYKESKGSVLSKLAGVADNTIADNKWICKSCGTPNDKLSGQCKGCGKYK